MPKTLTLRLADDQAAMLELVARAEDQTVTEAVRTAIDSHIEARRKDEAFMQRLRERHEREKALYDRLAK